MKKILVIGLLSGFSVQLYASEPERKSTSEVERKTSSQAYRSMTGVERMDFQHALEHYDDFVKYYNDEIRDPNIIFKGECGEEECLGLHEIPLLSEALMSGPDSEDLIKIVDFLIKQGAKVNGLPNSETTPLLDAVPSIPLMKLLLEKGADINIANDDGATPLMRAGWDANPAAVKFLIDRGANKNLKDKWGTTVLDHAIVDLNNSSDEATTAALKEIIPMFARLISQDAETAFANALQHYDDFVKYYNDMIKDPNLFFISGTPGNFTATSLLINVLRLGTNSQDLIRIIDFLIAQGARVNEYGWYGSTPLMYAAAWAANPAVVKLLLDRGANKNLKDGQGRTAFDIVNESLQNYPNWDALKEIIPMLVIIPEAPPAPFPSWESKPAEKPEPKKPTQPEQKKRAEWNKKYDNLVENMNANFPKQAYDLILNEGLNVQVKNSKGQTLLDLAKQAQSKAKGKKAGDWDKLMKLLEK